MTVDPAFLEWIAALPRPICVCGHLLSAHQDDVRGTRCDYDRLCGCPAYSERGTSETRAHDRIGPHEDGA